MGRAAGLGRRPQELRGRRADKEAARCIYALWSPFCSAWPLFSSGCGSAVYANAGRERPSSRTGVLVEGAGAYHNGDKQLACKMLCALRSLIRLLFNRVCGSVVSVAIVFSTKPPDCTRILCIAF